MPPGFCGCNGSLRCRSQLGNRVKPRLSRSGARIADVQLWRTFRAQGPLRSHRPHARHVPLHGVRPDRPLARQAGLRPRCSRRLFADAMAAYDTARTPHPRPNRVSIAVSWPEGRCIRAFESTMRPRPSGTRAARTRLMGVTSRLAPCPGGQIQRRRRRALGHLRRSRSIRGRPAPWLRVGGMFQEPYP